MQQNIGNRIQNSKYASFNLFKNLKVGDILLLILNEGQEHPATRLVKFLGHDEFRGKKGMAVPYRFRDVVVGKEFSLMFGSTHFPKNLVSAQNVRLSNVQENPFESSDEEDPSGVEELDFNR